jgi:hypothetical protein
MNLHSILVNTDWYFVMLCGVFLVVLGLIGIYKQLADKSDKTNVEIGQLAFVMGVKIGELTKEIKEAKVKIKKDGMITRKHLELTQKDLAKRIKKK